MLLFGFIILLTGTIGVLVTLFFAIVALIKRNSANWKSSGISLATTIVVIVSMIFVQETILYPPNPKIGQLVLSAYREAPIGGIWLGIYDDNTWQLGYSSKEITSEGTYRIFGDTLQLVANNGTTVIGDFNQTAFIIKAKSLIELNNSGIRSLEILQNKLDGQNL